MKKILGLDLGTNSIGWAVVKANSENESTENEKKKIFIPVEIESAGSRIIPMDAATLGDFTKGNSSKSSTKKRTEFRGTRRLIERTLLRRERIHRVLSTMDFLPCHYSAELDRYGKFAKDKEPKLAWKEVTNKYFEFIFKDSFNEMVEDFKAIQPELFFHKSNGEESKIPYDWTIYYLRKKALSKKISKEELAWLLLNFNQKRGYYQLRGEEEDENSSKLVEFHSLRVVSVEATDQKKGNEVRYNIHLENGWIYRRTSSIKLEWEGKIKEFIVTTDLENDGSPKKDKEGNIKRSFRAPKEDDWTLLKKKTEYDINNSHKTVGEYIYETLLNNANQKIRGKLVRTIERKYYKTELKEILEVQKQFHPELQNRELYAECINELYSHNDAHKSNIANNDFTHLFLNDIIFYQRPLKSKKSLISNCPYEEHYDPQGKVRPIKCIAKSNPLFQEFRLWQFVSNLKIYEREKEVDGKFKTDVDVTKEFLTTEDDVIALFEWLNTRKEIEQKVLLGKYFKLKKTKEKDAIYPYRWNYVEDKSYPCNETHALILSGLEKANISANILTPEFEQSIWHILYSVEDKNEIKTALKSFANKNGLDETFANVFSKLKPFKKEYGSYSAKAIKKLLSLMRMGKYWDYNNIDIKTKERIEKILTGEFDEEIKNRVREKTIELNNTSDFKGLPLWVACYIVYNRHSETKDITKWETPSDIDNYLKEFKQYSLRNSIVEQVVTETLRTVRDIWKQAGQIDEIHIELGREMKNPADVRKRMTENNINNENTNIRIKTMLAEFINAEYNIEGVRPHSPSQQEILHIYEDYALSNLNSGDKDYDFISTISKTAQPSKSDVLRYKLWLEQKYRSPYTGEMISLGKLFTSAYEIEHVIPQSRYFDDSFSNKVICEAEVNKLKDNALGYEFISKHHGEKVDIGFGKTVTIFNVEQYEEFVKSKYAKSRSKMQKLLMEDIPDGFIERQLNDSRYISKLITGLLSNIVREPNDDAVTSKNVIVCNGAITDRLKKDWGVGNVWNSIVLPRFERLNDITGTTHFTSTTKEGHIIPSMPLEQQKGFNKKRIDHRHHAMDAIVIACATRSHVNLLNNESAKSTNKSNRYALSRKLRRYETVDIERNGERKQIEVAREFLMPWTSFPNDVKCTLANIIVSFKHNLRVINKSSNHYEHYDENGKKVFSKQTKGEHWDIRKPMHKDTFFGEINLRIVKPVSLSEAIKTPKSIVEKELKVKILAMLELGFDVKKIKKYFDDNKDVWSDVNLSKIDVYYFTKNTKERYFSTRKPLDSSFDRKKIESSVADTGIQKILLRHLELNENNPELAFSSDGIDDMNRNIVALNNGKFHKPISKISWYEQANKFAVGQNGNKSAKFVETAKGTNLFFAVYESEVLDKESGEYKKKRNFTTIPLNIAIERQKQGLDSAPEDENGNPPIFTLSPGDLVYVPEEGEKSIVSLGNVSQIYKIVSFKGKRLYAVPHRVATTIIDKVEYTQQNKIELISEKNYLNPIKVDRLGNIIKI